MLLVYRRPSGDLPVDQELFFSLKFVFRRCSSLSFSTQVGRESLFCVRTEGGLGGQGGPPRPTRGSARLFDRAPFVAVAWILFHRLILQLLWRNLSSPSLWTGGICGGYVCQGLPKGSHGLSSRAHCIAAGWIIIIKEKIGNIAPGTNFLCQWNFSSSRSEMLLHAAGEPQERISSEEQLKVQQLY